MTNEVKLIRQYIPILHIHEEEPYLPEDCKRITELADLCEKKNGKNVIVKANPGLDGLPTDNNSKDLFLNLPMLDMKNFSMTDKQKALYIEQGPRGVARIAREKLGNNPILGFSPRKDNPKFYARIKHTAIDRKNGEVFTNKFNAIDPDVFGKYTVIQYIFFFIFNDSWNKHEGDWDSIVEIYINDDTGKKFIVTHLHETFTAGELVEPMNINDWIDEWKDEKKKGFKPVLCIAGGFTDDLEKIRSLHPNVFVALGAHGGYLTPGYDVHGRKVPILGKIIGTTDERQIGRTVIYPSDSTSDQMILSVLAKGKIAGNKTNFLPWKKFEILKDQKWLNYKGKWGEETNFNGWDGPTGPKNRWRASQWRLKKKIIDQAYDGELPKHTFINWHGWSD